MWFTRPSFNRELHLLAALGELATAMHESLLRQLRTRRWVDAILEDHARRAIVASSDPVHRSIEPPPRSHHRC